MILRVLFRIATAGMLGVLLSACWMSDKELITEKSGAAVGFAGAYRETDAEHPDNLDLRIAPAGGTAYVMTNDKQDQVPVRFLDLGRDWYLMQYEGRSDEEGAGPYYIYLTLKRVGSDLHLFSSECKELTGKFKGMKREDGAVQACNFSRLDGLKSAAQSYIAQMERGAAVNEPKILKYVGPV